MYQKTGTDNCFRFLFLFPVLRHLPFFSGILSIFRYPRIFPSLPVSLSQYLSVSPGVLFPVPLLLRKVENKIFFTETEYESTETICPCCLLQKLARLVQTLLS